MSNNIEKKRIIIVTQYFYPENFKSNDIAFELHKKGYLVDVLTSIPNYPEGKYYKGYNIFRKRIQKINGVRVYRALQIPRGKNNITLSLNYISFVIFASIWAFILAFIKKYKCIIVHEPSPITQGIPAIIIKKIQRIPLYFWVLDIWPDAIKSGGGISNTRVIKIIEKITIKIYDNCDFILISSKGFRKLITKLRYRYNDKIVYFPNWSEDALSYPNDYQIPELPPGFKILLTGNLGKSQDLESILKAINHLKNYKKIKWLFVGDGSKKYIIDNFIKENELYDTVFTYGRYPFEAIPTFFSKADALLISLKGNHPHLQEVIPARLQSYMSSGKPIIGMISGGAADIIKEANCGKVIESGQWLELANLITKEIMSNLKEFRFLGDNGRIYYEKNYTKEKCINHLINIIEQKIDEK